MILTVFNRYLCRYRFRLVSISCDPNYTFSIDGHPLTVIEADGVSTQPVTVDSIQIFAAQRYSFVVSSAHRIALGETYAHLLTTS